MPKKSSVSCFDDHNLVTLMLIIMKRLVMRHIDRRPSFLLHWTLCSFYVVLTTTLPTPPAPSRWAAAPQGCMLSPLLFTLMTHNCKAIHGSNHIIRFADDTTVVGLISRKDYEAYRVEVQQLVDWCCTNNLSLNVNKTKKMVCWLRLRRDHFPLSINDSPVETVQSTHHEQSNVEPQH